MKMRHFLIVLMLFAGLSGAKAQSNRQEVVNSITRIENMINAHKWSEAFTELRYMESHVGENPALLYILSKQRYMMYSRIKKNTEAAAAMQRMEQLALQSNDSKTIEDMLHAKALYHAQKGDTNTSRQCYIQMLNRRAAGKDDQGKEKCFKDMIAEAEKMNNSILKRYITDAYATWQDSISQVRAKEELTKLKVDYETAQKEISSKATKIKIQWGTILVLGILLAAAVVAVVLLLLIMIRNIAKIKRLTKKLEVSNGSSQQKSVFMRNISNQISSSLREIASGNARPHITALEKMLSDVETYINLDDSKEEPYETEESNVAEICENVIQTCSGHGAPVTGEIRKQVFTLNKEAVTELLVKVITEVQNTGQAQGITLGFSKRSPHKGQFVVTANGWKMDEEQKATLFTAFAKVYDLTKTTGLVMPISAMMAHKMNGTLSINDEYTKGTKLVLEVVS